MLNEHGQLMYDPQQIVDHREKLLSDLDQLHQRYQSLVNQQEEANGMRVMLDNLVSRDAQQQMLANLDPAKLDDPKVHQFI